MFRIVHIPTASLDNTARCPSEYSILKSQKRLSLYLEGAKSIYVFEDNTFIFSSCTPDTTSSCYIGFIPEHFILIEVEDGI